MRGYNLTAEDISAIERAINGGLDVRIHPDKYGIKITSEQIRVLRKPDAPQTDKATI